MPLDEMQTRFTISLVKQSESEIRLKFIPMVASLKSNYSQVELILAPRTYEPRAMRIVSPTGDSDDVYTFNNVQINRTQREPDPDLWRLDFKGYRQRISYRE